MKSNKKLFFLGTILIALTVITKLICAPTFSWSGFSPIIAIALFSGMLWKKKDTSFLFPLLALFVSDCIIQLLYYAQLFPFSGFYKGQLLNYFLLLLVTSLGIFLKGHTRSSLIIGALVAPSLFFLFSNFYVWVVSTEVIYPKSFSGLLQCYQAGIPFFKNSIVATMVFLPFIIYLYNAVFNKEHSFVLSK